MNTRVARLIGRGVPRYPVFNFTMVGLESGWVGDNNPLYCSLLCSAPALTVKGQANPKLDVWATWMSTEWDVQHCCVPIGCPSFLTENDRLQMDCQHKTKNNTSTYKCKGMLESCIHNIVERRLQDQTHWRITWREHTDILTMLLKGDSRIKPTDRSPEENIQIT